jgi:uncharacterized protein (TIRG00374 family)
MTLAQRRVLRLVALLVLAGLLWGFGRSVDWRSAAQAVRSADPLLLGVALVLNLLSLSLKGVRWWVLLRPLGRIELRLVLRATFAGASLNNLVVAQGGEGARVLIVSRAAGVSSAGVLSALGLERALDVVSYLALLVGAAWTTSLPGHIARWRLPAAGVLVAAVVALVVLAIATRRQAAPAVAAGGRLAAYLRRARAALALVATPGRLVLAILLSLAAWTLQVATYHLTAVAAHLPLPLAGSVAAMLAIGISFLIRATPGNVGVFQVIYALTVRSFGIAEGPAVAVALLIQTLQVVPTVLLGTLVAPRLLRGTRSPAG